MELIKVIILGITEGLTEFLPISSTGHVIVAEKLLNYRDEAALFTVVVQLGAILAAAWYFRHDLAYIVKKVLVKDRPMTKFALNVFIGLLPAGIVGFIVEKTVGLTDSLVIISASMIVGGLVLLLVEKYANIATSNPSTVNYSTITSKKSLLIGAAQCLAIIPGVSRSGATIVGGLLVGLDRKTAAVFSFYLGIPIMLAASALKIAGHHSAISQLPAGSAGLVLGVVASAVSGFLVVKWLMTYIQSHTFKPFAYYRIGAGVVLLVLAVNNWI